MLSRTMTLALPEPLYRTVYTLAQVTKRPLAEILQESLAHTLPPLDDVPAAEAECLAQMSTMEMLRSGTSATSPCLSGSKKPYMPCLTIRMLVN